eukprot:g18692.t1
MCGQILVNVFQTIAILGMMTVAWPEIFQTTSKSFKVFLLDLESFSLSCVAGKSSLQQFAVSTLLFPCAALWLLFLQAASQCLPDTWRKSRRKWPRSINTIGVFLEAGFGTMSAVGLQPLMCYSHPSGLYSVLKFPNVICQSGDHVAMVILGVALLCFALAFFSACVMACWKMPSWSLTDGHELVQSFRFLTSQFRMDAWWFGVLLPLRGFFLSLSVAVATDLPPAQAAAAAVVLAIYAPFQMRWWPWKVPYINQADLWMNIMLLLLVNSSVVVEGNTSVEWREFGQTYAMSNLACDEWIDPACKAISKKASQALHHCAEQLMDIEVTTLEGQLMRMNPSDLNIITSSITLISMEICPSSEQQLFHMRGKSITEAADKIELLTADMEAAGSDATRLETELAQHQVDLETQSGELANATGIREKARANFLATLKDYTESINAIGSALKVLKETAAGPSLVQLNEVKKMLPLDAIKSIDEYLALSEKKPSLLMKTTAQAHRSEPEMYEFQSGGVVSLLENLDEKFVAERSTLEKEELAKKHAHEKLAASLEAAIAQSKKEIESKSQFRAKRLQTKASAEGDLAETTTEKASDEKKHLPSLLGTSLAFLRSESPTQLRVAKFLQARATALNSRVLSAMAARAGADPMSKVKAMIEQLLVKMEEQANQEATKKGWCDAELKENKAIREEKAEPAPQFMRSRKVRTSFTEDVAEGLQSEIDEVTASITKLGEELATLQKELTSLERRPGSVENHYESAMSEATAIREKEKAKNEGTLKDAKEAQAAEYDEFMDDSKVDKSQELTMLEGDLQGTQKELDAANVYYEKLKPDCIDTSESFAERKAQREQELKDLQSALDMLNEDSTGTLMRVRKPVGELYLQAMQRKKPLLQASAPELSERFLTALRRRSALRPAFGTGEVGGARGWWRGVVAETLEGCDLEKSDFEAVFQDLYDEVFTGEDSVTLFPHTESSLVELRQWCDRSACRLGVLSNMDDRLTVILDRLGILQKFDFTRTSFNAIQENLKAQEKPSKEIFDQAKVLAGVDGQSLCLHCGDSEKRDLLGALRSGWAAALLKTAEPSPEVVRLELPEFEAAMAWKIPDLSHLPRLAPAMQFRWLLLVAPVLGSYVTPVQKVIDMMEKMKEKGTKQMEDEQLQFAEFRQFCELTLDEKERSISDATDKIETLQAQIAAAGADAERLEAEAAQHQADAETATSLGRRRPWETQEKWSLLKQRVAWKEQANTTEVREKERSDFQTTLQDYTESIDAIGRAMKSLKEDKDKKVSLLELTTAKSLKRMPSDAPQEQQEKTQFKTKKLQSKASDSADLEETRAAKASDVKYATDLKATCEKKEAAYQQPIAKAQEIISSGTVAGNADKHLPGLLQRSKLTALAFLRAEHAAHRGQEHGVRCAARDPPDLQVPAVLQDQVARFLQRKADQLKSRMLSALAVRVSADPLSKVKTMIEQLMEKLTQQA